jgi:CcmD family protein
VFAAYTIVIALIGGWAFSIARRLRSLEERLVD